MGFLKFLKKEKKQDSLDELDLPPAPPPLSNFDEKLPDFPEFPNMDRGSLSDTENMPKFDIPKEEEISEPDKDDFMQDFHSFGDVEESPINPIPPITADTLSSPKPPIPEHMEESEQDFQESSDIASQEFESKIEKKIFSEEKRVLTERPDLRVIYVKVDRFKSTLGSINIVRNDLKKSEEALMRLENIKNAKDKSLDIAKSSLEDLQKKLIFIDKALFKGE